MTTGVNILSGAQDRPLLILSRVEKGRVGLLLSDQMWLWARGYDGGGPHLDLLRRLAHWLMKEPELEEEALRASARGQSLTIERQSLNGDTPEITITAPSGGKSSVVLSAAEPGLSRATLDVGELGLYRVSDGDHTALVNVGPDNPIEFQEVVSTPEHLRALAEATGGSVRRIASGEGDAVALPRLISMHEAPSYGGSDYIGVKRTGASELIGVASAPLASGLLGLAALLGIVVLVWRREGTSGAR
jgi:hypothetical protein